MTLTGRYYTLGTVVLLATLAVPWFVPMRGVGVSASHAAGFSNNAAIALLISGCLVSGILALVAEYRQRLPSLIGELACDAPLSRRHVALWAAFTAVVMGTVSWLTHASPYEDAAYFIRSAAYRQAGYVPYRDFEFSYGTLPLDVVNSLARLMPGLDVSVAYEIVAVTVLVSGVILVAWVLRYLPLETRVRAVAFDVLCLVPFINLPLGLNATNVRFLAPVAITVLAARYLLAPSITFSRIALLTSVILLLAMAFPERALAAAAAVAVMAVVARRPFAQATAVSVAAGLAALAPALGGALTTARSFAGGSGDLPLLPGPPAVASTLLFVLAVTAGGAIAGRAFARTRLSTNELVVIGLAVLTVLQIPAALHRADFMHLYWNGLPALLAAACVASSTSSLRRTAVWLATGSATVFLFMAAAYTLVHHVPIVVVAAVRGNGWTINADAWEDRLPATLKAKLARLEIPKPGADFFGSATRGEPVATLFLEGDIDRALRSSSLVRPAYMSSPASRDELERTIASLRDADYVAIYADEAEMLAPAVGAQARVALARRDALLLGGIPWSVPARYPTDDMRGALIEYIKVRGRLLSTVGNYAVYRLRSDGVTE